MNLSKTNNIMTFKEILDSHQYTQPELINALFTWSYKNDKRLYANLDNHLSAHAYRSRVNGTSETGAYMIGCNENTLKLSNSLEFNAMEVMTRAIALSDYHDTYKFRWSFTAGGANRIDDYMYKHNELHEFSDIIQVINNRLCELEKLGLNDWRKSADHEKHSWYRNSIQNLIDKSHDYNSSVGLLFVWQSNSFVASTFSLDVRKEILQFILDNNIVPDIHNKSIEYRGFGEDNRNPRVLKNLLGRNNLVYLTADEMMELYATLKKHKIDNFDKPVWAFIKTLLTCGQNDSQFYINIKE